MKNINKLLSLILAVFMLAVALPAGILTAEVVNTVPDTEGEPVWDAPGAIQLDKYASANLGTEDDPYWEITLEIEGKNFPTTSDVVLVIDNSNSMYTDRMPKVKQAAIAFANNLLTDNSTRIALVVYGRDIDLQTGFYDASTKNELIAKINSIYKKMNNDDGGTNTQLGIYTAQQILDSDASTGRIKSIVLLSDGVPTYSYKLTGTATWTGCVETLWHSWDGIMGSGKLDTSSIVITGVQDHDTDSRVGSGYTTGSSYYQPGKVDLTVTCNHGYSEAVSDYGITHTVGTIFEANQVKAEGTTVYSISFQADTTGEAMLKDCASDSSKGYFAISQNESDVSGKLQSAFDAIAGDIAAAATNSVVTDPMGEFVNLKFEGSIPVITNDLAVYEAGNADVYVSQGTASYDADTDTITWSSGTIREGTTAIMKYHIVVDTAQGEAVPQGELDANKETIFDYTNYQGNAHTIKHFPIPVVNISGGIVRVHYYRVDRDGNPITEGGVLTERQHAQIADYDQYTGLEWGVDYNYEPKAIDTYVYYGSYSIDDGALTVGNIATVRLNVNKKEYDIWFPYYQEEFTIVHVRNDGTENITETYPVSKDFNFVDKTKDDYLYGGTFNDIECTEVTTSNPYDYDGVKANDTYYIWEVNKLYLTPKNVNAWRHINVEGSETIVRFYPLTVVDRDMYQVVDFLIDGEMATPDNDEVYTKIYAEQPVVGPDGSEQTTVSELSYRIWGNTAIVKDGSHVAYDRYLKFDEQDPDGNYKPFTIQPYWITLDNVMVTGDVVRTCTYRGAGIPESDNTTYYRYMDVSDESAKMTRTYLGSTSDDVNTLSILDPVAIGMEEIVEDVTLTIVDGNNTYSVEAPAGDFTESVSYIGMDDMLFAGWFMDGAYSQAADLTNVTEDATIYAKYVTDAYLNVKCINLRSIFSKTATFVSAIDNPDNYLEVGFVVTVDGGETVIETGSFANSYLFYNARNLFGNGIDKTAKLMTLDYSLSGMSYGTVVNVQPYWVTMDGTTVYGKSTALTYTIFGLIG